MASQKSYSSKIDRNSSGYPRISKATLLLATLFLIAPLTGCQRWPNGQAMKQYQMESDRLLAEFRAQKKRAEELEVRNNQLEQRLAESEKMVARSQLGLGGRSTASQSIKGGNSPELLIGDARGFSKNTSGLSENDSSRANPGRSKILRGGLPDTKAGTSGTFTSVNPKDPISIGGNPRDLKGDPKAASQWRPVHRGN